VNSAPKSSASKTWRISISQSSLCGVGAALDPLDGFFLGFDPPDPEAADEFLRFHKGSVGGKLSKNAGFD
jgi:hypothetical protein